MFEMVQLLAGTNLFLLAFSVLIFDIRACAVEATEWLRATLRSA
jgi:hypothetical protein